jgi:hypothetical protein
LDQRRSTAPPAWKKQTPARRAAQCLSDPMRNVPPGIQIIFEEAARHALSPIASLQRHLHLWSSAPPRVGYVNAVASFLPQCDRFYSDHLQIS